MILRMISLNSLSAFTQEISRTPQAQPVRAPAGVQSNSRDASPVEPVQRPLGAVPQQPTGPVPRGSLLDLRV